MPCCIAVCDAAAAMRLALFLASLPARTLPPLTQWRDPDHLIRACCLLAEALPPTASVVPLIVSLNCLNSSGSTWCVCGGDCAWEDRSVVCVCVCVHERTDQWSEEVRTRGDDRRKKESDNALMDSP